MKKRLILSVLIGVLFLALFVVFILSGVRAYKLRKREFYVKNVNPKIRIEVINASGVPGLAKKVTFLLREDGFDVVYFTHVAETLNKSVIVERSDSSFSHAKHLSKWLGVPEITLEWDYDKISDCALVIGTDYQKYFPGIDTLTIIY